MVVAAQLPKELWVLILSKLDTQEEVFKCAAVNKPFQSAAMIVASKSVQLHLTGDCRRFRAITAWLARHTVLGLSIYMTTIDAPIGWQAATAPCQATLQQLTLHNFQFVGTCGSAPGLGSLMQLTHLKLSAVWFKFRDTTALHQVSCLSALQQLCLLQLHFDDGAKTGLDLQQACSGLAKLTKLQAGGSWANNKVLKQLCSITHLRSLCVDGCSCSEAVLVSLQQLLQLTSLALVNMPGFNFQDNSNTTVSFRGTTGLAELRLHTLKRANADILATFSPSQLKHVAVCGTSVTGNTQGVTKLLLWLGSVSALEDLQLAGSIHSCLEHPAALQFGQLTSSGSLTSLDLSNNPLSHPMQLAVNAMFHHGKLLPRLRKLQLQLPVDSRMNNNSKLTGHALYRLAASCPNLQELKLCGVTQQAALLEGLTALRQLTALSITGLDRGSLPWLLCMVKLRCLDISRPHAVGKDELQQLTARTQLVQLSVEGLGRCLKECRNCLALS